jgi:hypothetical protein
MPLKMVKASKTYLVMTITDGDGDKSTATITITINGHTDGAPNVVITDHNGSALVRTALPKMQRPQYKASLPSTQQMD